MTRSQFSAVAPVRRDTAAAYWSANAKRLAVRLALLCALCTGVPLGLAASPQEKQTGSSYRLGPEDKVRLKVFEWRPATDEIFEWKALNDEFTVSADGTLPIPLAGRVNAAGLTPDAVAILVSEQLQSRLHLSAPPDASIDVVQYRPFFVAGDVARPGPYPFHPGLTVLEAVAVAGGIDTAGKSGLLRFDRDVISEEGELVQLGRDCDALFIRRARLQAEINAKETFETPAEIADGNASDFVRGMMQAEMKIFDARSRAFTAQTTALNELKTFLVKEGESLDAQLVTIDTQLALINKELTSVASLVEKGIAVAPRQLALERSVAQIQGDRLSMQTNKLRVQEETSKTDLSIIELRSNRVTEASIELRETELKIDAVMNKTVTGGKLLFDSKVTAPHLLDEYMSNSRNSPRYELVRDVDGHPVSITAAEDARVEPGDTIKVVLPIPSALGAMAASTQGAPDVLPARERAAYP